MKLKTLEISGFKSFADKTTIEFMPGMTGIVGPNGSGKSNIIEAIRWVMGEQRAKDLRGTKMSDVIFGGTHIRHGLNRAEVSMTFDNDDQYLNTLFSEVTITRKLYRSGESVYQINGVDSRLRDVQDLFTDTGLGKESFSIISQGRVESIFNAKPEERRAIIEEVAGVHKYKQNKDKAQRELEQTNDNLSRVGDIVYEIEQRLDGLAQQSAQATDYLSQKERYELLDQSRLALLIQQLNNKQVTTKRALADQQTQVKSAKQAADDLETRLADQRQEQADLSQQQEQAQQQVVTLIQKKEQLIGAQNLKQQQYQNLTSELHATQSRLEKLTETLDANAVYLETLEQRKLTADQKYQELSQTVSQLDQQASENQQETLQAKINSNRAAYIEIMQAIAGAHNNSQTAQKEIKRLEQRQKTLVVKYEQVQHDLVEHQQALKTYQAEHGELIDMQQLTTTVTKHNQLLKQQQKDYHEQEQVWYQTLKTVSRVKTDLQARTALDEYAAFHQGVRTLMQDNVRQQFKGIKGVISDLITVPSDYAYAIEITLGGTLQHVVVDYITTAKHAIKYLSQHKAGRVTLLPIEAIKSRHIDTSMVEHLEGFVGLAADLVKMPKDMTAIKYNILGTTVIAKDLESATQIAKAAQYHFRVVSLDGQIVNAGGSLTGGMQHKQSHTLLSRQQALSELEDKLTELKHTADTQEKKLQNQRDLITVTTQDLDTAQQALQAAKSQSNQTDYELEKYQNVVTEHERQLKTLEYEQSDLIQLLAERQQEYDTSQSELQQLSKKQAETESAYNELTQQSTQLSENYHSTQEKRVTARSEWTKYQAQSQNLSEQTAQLVQQQVQQQAEKERLQVHIDTLQNNMRILTETLTEDKVSTISHELQTLQGKQKSLQATTATLAVTIQKIEQQLMIAQGNVRLATEEQGAILTRQASLQTKIEHFEQQLMAEYNVKYTQVPIERVTQTISDIEEQLALLKKSINELGHVNIGAIEEYEQVKQRYDFLTQQRDDLNTAKDNLMQTIEEMDDEVQTRFKTTFDAVSHHFSKIFSQMFGGGRAEIQLTDAKHLLTTGIDIIAQPPGKKFQQMSLLSGGEKALTAITLLFAILHVRPVPFVVLDEAEAALDEANVARFSRYLHDFGGHTQFIVITHRKGTMMQANLLYGVTMQEAGVSKMVAIDLDHIDAS